MRRESNIFSYEAKYSPMRWFNCWSGLLKGRAGWYVSIRFVPVLASLILAEAWSAPSFYGIPLDIFPVAIGALFLLDILIANTSIAFISRGPVHILRSIVLTIFSFAQVVVIFAVFYVSLEDSFTMSTSPEPAVKLNPVQATYFSLVTITTLGYGDFLPKSDMPWVQIVVMFELIVGLYFIAVVLVVIIGWTNAPPNIEPPKTYRLSDLKKPNS